MYDISKSKILIVDDSKTSVDMLVRALEKNYRLIKADNGIKALEYAEKKQPDLIMQDIVMQGLDGFDTCKRLKKNPLTKNIPIIFITAVDNSEHRTKSFEMGAVDYITKPFDLSEVRARVKNHLTLKAAQQAVENQNIILEDKIRERTQELTRVNELVQQNQKMEAIGTLASGISHDFNNILTPIMIQTELALMKLPENSSLEPHLKKIYKAGERAKDLVNQILSFCRPGEIKQKPFRVSPIVKEALKLLRASLPTTIEIQQDIQSDADMIVGDPTQIHQVLMNLCANAGHAMRKNGGVLKVSLEKISQVSKEMKKMTNLEPGDYLKLTVKDTGIGMDDKTRKRIFEPYFTTKAKSEGTGLGLAVVNRIVTDYGGMIMVKSTPGTGTIFKIYFPSVSSIPYSKSSNDEKPHIGAERILFVDDEEETVEALEDSLGHLGYQVIGETSSIEAYKKFKADPFGFDIVITDQTMPKMTGDELAGKIIRIRPDIPIILCTGYTETIKNKTFNFKGIKEIISKPFDINIITEAIKKSLSG